MSGLPVSIGDIASLCTILYQTCNKCKNAPSEYQGFARIIESNQLCVKSTRLSIEDIYDDLPKIHKICISNAIARVRDVAVAILDDLNQY